MANDTLKIFGTTYNGVPGIKATDSSNNTKTYIRPQGSETKTQNGTYDVTSLAEVVVNVSAASPTLQSKTATPSESQQTISPDSGYDGLSSVTVDAVSSTYVGSQISRRSNSDLVVNGSSVNAPAGYYAAGASKSVASGTAGTPTATKGTVSRNSITVTPSVTNNTGYITGETVTGTGVIVTASELVSGSETKTQNGTYDVTNLAELVVAVPSPSLQSKTATPTTSQQTISPDSGYDGLSSVTVNAIPSNYIVPTGNKAITENGLGIDVAAYSTVSVSVSANLGVKTIEENGTYNALADSLDGYSRVVVSVPTSGGVNIGTKTATASNYPVSLSFTGMLGEPKAFFLKSTSQISSSGNTTYYYIISMRYNGTNTTGSCFRIGGTRRVDHITSGYSWSYSGTTLTITSSASSRSASPGAFNNAYELVYIY